MVWDLLIDASAILQSLVGNMAPEQVLSKLSACRADGGLQVASGVHDGIFLN